MLLQFYPQGLIKHKFYIAIADDDYVIMHGHEFLEFSYIVSGTMRHTFNGEENVLRSGDYFIVDHGTEHAYQRTSKEPLKIVNLLFLPEFLERTLAGCLKFEVVVNSYLLRFNFNSFRSTPTGKAFHDTTGKIRTLLDEICGEYDSHRYGYLEYIRCLFVQILIHAMRTINTREEAPITDACIAEIMDDLAIHYAQKSLLSDYAPKYNCSVSYLSKKFAEETGMPFSTYVQHLRIEHSCRLLQRTNLRVNEIAYRVGYADTKFFNQVFKSTLGITPSEYRKTHPYITPPDLDSESVEFISETN